MSEQKNVASLDTLLQPTTNNVQFDTVEAYGQTVRIGSCSSFDMLQWVEANADPVRRKRAGLRLLVKSICDAEGVRYPADKHDDYIEVFAQKDALENGKVLAKVFVLNGFPVPGQTEAHRKEFMAALDAHEAAPTAETKALLIAVFDRATGADKAAPEVDRKNG